jgi:hypothetical protein
VKQHLRHVLGGWRAALLAGLRPPALRMLLVSDGRKYTSEQQFAPIWRHRSRLRRELGLAVDWRLLDGPMPTTPSRYDLIGLKMSFRRSAEAVASTARRWAGRGPPLIYFDGDDDSAILWPELLDVCDLYVKKHVFADPGDYARRFIGKSNLTDHVARTAGRSFADDIIPAAGGIDPARLATLHLGWNIALDDRIAGLSPWSAEAPRSIDICSRASAPPDKWLHDLRAPAVAALEALPTQWRVAVPRARVSQADYDRELRSARICVSPFGYGEICWRDFEAIMAGCLLVKPDMAHIRTAPDLFVPGETYVPVAWDYSDLETVCAPFLADEGARLTMVRRAQARLVEALSADWFVARVRALLDRVVRQR